MIFRENKIENISKMIIVERVSTTEAFLFWAAPTRAECRKAIVLIS